MATFWTKLAQLVTQVSFFVEYLFHRQKDSRRAVEEVVFQVELFAIFLLLRQSLFELRTTLLELLLFKGTLAIFAAHLEQGLVFVVILLFLEFVRQVLQLLVLRAQLFELVLLLLDLLF